MSPLPHASSHYLKKTNKKEENLKEKHVTFRKPIDNYLSLLFLKKAMSIFKPVIKYCTYSSYM